MICAALAAVALICVLATPSRALAAMVCNDATMAAESVADLPEEEPWTLLEVELPDDDTIELRRDEAPMSLTEGASAVAPRTVHRTSDARIEASRRCEDHVGAQELVAPDDRPTLEPPSSVMDASLAELPLLRAAARAETIDLCPPAGMEALGIYRGVDRPPRR